MKKVPNRMQHLILLRRYASYRHARLSGGRGAGLAPIQEYG